MFTLSDEQRMLIETVRRFIREGERATWPTLARVQDQTRLGRVFRECVEALKAKQARS